MTGRIQKYTAQDKRDCARREVKQREHVYPRLVEKGSMTQGLADMQIDMMKEIAADYEELAKKDRLL